MPLANRFRILCSLAGFAFLIASVGCGSSPVVAHQSGSYTNASFKGSYVIQMHGFVVTSTGSLLPYREVGVITADGNGTITAGIDNASVFGAGAPTQNTSATGTYSIGNDGTGEILLNSSALGSVVGSSGGQITLFVTLASTSTAELVEGDTFAEGSGVANLQDSSAATTLPNGAFVFRLHEDSNAQQSSESEVGLFNISGSSVTGSLDENVISTATSLTINSGNITAPSASGVGTITFTDSSNTTTSLIYCVVNSTNFAFIASTSGVVGAGSAEAQTGTVGSGLSGTYAFGSRGDDLNSGVGAEATVGQFTAGGASFSSGALDAMDDGSYAGPVSFTGTAVGSPSAQGRVAVTLSAGPTMVFWLVSQSRAFFLFENESASEDGTADLQTGGPFSAGTIKGQYALVMDGLDFVNGQGLARIGTLQFDGSSKITLVEVVNGSSTGSGAQNPGTLAGNYQVGSSGRITSQITGNNGGGPDLVMYAVSGSQAYVLQNDSGENTSGIIQLQQ